MSTKEPSDTIVLRTEAIKARLKKITPGDWRIFGRAVVNVINGKRIETSGFLKGDIALCESLNDVEFIANAPDDLDWCVKRIEALEEELRVRCEAEEKTAPHNWCDECLDYVDMQIEKRGEGVQADYIGTCPICGHKNFW